jgi:hypothetical protein
LGLFPTAGGTVEVDSAQRQLKRITRSTTANTLAISINAKEMVNIPEHTEVKITLKIHFPNDAE